MGWLQRRRARKMAEFRAMMRAESREQIPNMVEALFKALGQFAQVQVDFAKGLADINVSRSAKLMGSRGGKRTQALKKIKKLTGDCPWCKGDDSIDALQWHRANHLRANGDAGDLPNEKAAGPTN